MQKIIFIPMEEREEGEEEKEEEHDDEYYIISYCRIAEDEKRNEMKRNLYYSRVFF